MPKVKAATATEACKSAAIGDEARALLTPQVNVAEFLTLLTDHELFADAVTLMAHALPKREAVWWACLAARTLTDEQTLPEVVAALEAAEAWVFKPSDEARRATMERARKTQFDHPAVWAAVGAFWSGGSMVAPELPEVPPAEHLTGLAVSGAVRLSAVSREPERAPEKYRALLAQALDIANGGNGQVNKAN
jgi:hypothetical protein